MAGVDSLVVHVNAAGAVMGGAARHLPAFVSALTAARPGWRIRLELSGELDRGSLPPGVEVRLTGRRSHPGRVLYESTTLVREARRADVLLNLTNSGPLWSATPSILYQRNALWFDRAWLASTGPRVRAEAAVRRALAFAQMRAAAVTIVPSHAMAGLVRDWREAPRGARIEVVPHAVDQEAFPFRSRPWPPPDRRVRLLMVSHAAEHKDQALVIELTARLRRLGWDASGALTVAPQDAPGYVDRLQRRVHELGLGSSVQFLGRSSDVASLLAGADVFVFASRSESFGFPVVEAMAVGVPVVAADIPATRELTAGLGWLFPPGDVGQAAERVAEVLAVPADAMHERLRRASGAVRGLTWEANAASVAEIVEGCVSGRARQA